MRSSKKMTPKLDSCSARIKIAIDGPAASGKTTIARNLAKHFGFLLISTGAMYRAVAWGFLNGLKLEELQIEITPQERVLLNGKDITDELHSDQIDEEASKASERPEVRSFLIKKQRELAEEKNVVMEGRDVGAVVLPDADVKLFLTASLEERARRRFQERHSKEVRKFTSPQVYKQIKQSLQERDERDSRSFGRLQVAPNAVIINTDHKSIAQVTAEAIAIIESRLKSLRKLV